jgi:putative redox protein
MGEITASAVWTDKDRFIGTASSGHAIVVDAGAQKSANGPMELVLIALCSCTAVDVVSILRKKREPFTRVEVHAESVRSPQTPRVYTKIKLVYRVGGAVNRKSVEDAVRLSMEKYCSVDAMLKKTAEVSFEIVME